MKPNKQDAIWIAALGIALLITLGFVYDRHFVPEWKDYQEEFREMIAEKYGEARAAQAPSGIQQIWVKELKRVDRCTTCHQGVEWKGLENAPEPFRTHSKEALAKHPISKYGCTVCHGGQGYAVDTDSAHAVAAEHWEEPLLGAEMATAYTVSNKNALLQVNCNGCHRYDRETKGADVINRGKQLVAEKGCRACHVINGRGGTVGPSLTNVGELSPEQYDYDRLSGKKSVFAWHVAHFKDPKAMSPATVMPNFGLNSKDAQALTLLVMSWKKNDLPVEYIPGFKQADVPTPEEQQREREMLTGKGAFFVRKGCFICHDVSSFGIQSAAKIGPDLSIAVADVQSRFGRTLEDFLAQPTGTMAVVLSTQIHLSDAERAEAIEKLHQAYEMKQAESGKGAAQGQVKKGK